MHDCRSRLFHGGGGQRRKTDHISHSENIWNVGSIIFVNEDQAALSHFYAHLFQSQTFNITLPACRDQRNFKVMYPAFLKREFYMILLRFNRNHAIIENKIEAERGELIHEAFGDL